jgi:hypothetical protein
MKKLRVISRASFRRNSDTQFVTPIMEVAIVPGLPSHTVSLGHETVIPVTVARKTQGNYT